MNLIIISQMLSWSCEEVGAEQHGRNSGGCGLCFEQEVWSGAGGAETEDVGFWGNTEIPHPPYRIRSVSSVLHRSNPPLRFLPSCSAEFLGAWGELVWYNNFFLLIRANYEVMNASFIITSFKLTRFCQNLFFSLCLCHQETLDSSNLDYSLLPTMWKQANLKIK